MNSNDKYMQLCNKYNETSLYIKCSKKEKI